MIKLPLITGIVVSGLERPAYYLKMNTDCMTSELTIVQKDLFLSTYFFFPPPNSCNTINIIKWKKICILGFFHLRLKNSLNIFYTDMTSLHSKHCKLSSLNSLFLLNSIQYCNGLNTLYNYIEK